MACGVEGPFAARLPDIPAFLCSRQGIRPDRLPEVNTSTASEPDPSCNTWCTVGTSFHFQPMCRSCQEAAGRLLQTSVVAEPMEVSSIVRPAERPVIAGPSGPSDSHRQPVGINPERKFLGTSECGLLHAQSVSRLTIHYFATHPFMLTFRAGDLHIETIGQLGRAMADRMVGAVLRRNGKVLLCLRSSDRAHYPGVWDVPGGHLNKLESPEQGLARELEEELGIKPHIPGGGPWETQRIDDFEFSVFVIDHWVGEIQNRDVHEHDDVRWVGLEGLAHLDLAHPSLVELLTRAMDA